MDAFEKIIGYQKVKEELRRTADMLYWAMQYTDECEVVEPLALREKIRETIIKAKEKYES